MILLLAVWFLLPEAETEPAEQAKSSSIISWVVVFGLLVMGAIIRLNAYGDNCQAVLTSDTQKFVTLSGEPLLSPDFFTANRPAFILLAYKVAGVNPQMTVTEYSKPEQIVPRQVYADLNCLSGWQTWLSVFSWSVLALVLAGKLRSRWLRLIITVLVLGFAYLPQLAEWDFVIQSESISFSMWALTFALSIELVWRVVRRGRSQASYWFTWLEFALWIITLILWGFSRDTNIYMILLLGVSALFVLIIPSLRKHISVRVLLPAALLCLVFFGLQNALLYRSDRWINPFFNNIIFNILPHPEREAWFLARGMPPIDPKYHMVNLLSQQEAQSEIADLISWTAENGSGLYTRYLLTHPSWALTHFWKWSPIPFRENVQTYIKPDLDTVSPFPQAMGDILHPKTSSIIWIQLVIMLGMVGQMFLENPSHNLRGALIIFGLFFVGEIGMLFVSIHGDALGIIRHALVSVMPLRFNIWILTVFLLDNSTKSIKGE